MTGIWKLMKTPGVTNAHVRVLNWVLLAVIGVELLLLLFVGDARATMSRIGAMTGSYVLLLLFAPKVFRWFNPEVPVERKEAWRVGVVAYGSVALAHILWTLSPLFD